MEEDEYFDRLFVLAKTGTNDEIATVLKRQPRGLMVGDVAISGVCFGGNLNVLKMKEESCVWNFYNLPIGFREACRGGQKKVILFFLSETRQSMHSVNYGLESACEGGHKSVVELLLKHGATSFNGGLRQACRANHMDIAQMMVERGARDLDTALITCVIHDRLEMSKWLLEKMGNFISSDASTVYMLPSEALRLACIRRNQKMVRLFVTQKEIACGVVEHFEALRAQFKADKYNDAYTLYVFFLWDLYVHGVPLSKFDQENQDIIHEYKKSLIDQFLIDVDPFLIPVLARMITSFA